MNKYSIEEEEPLNNLKRVLKIMRITLFFLFFTILFSQAASSYSQEPELTLNLKSVSIQEVCKEIEKNSDFIFVFSDNSEKIIEKKVNVNVFSKSIKEILDVVCFNNNLKYKILDKQIVVYESKETSQINNINRTVPTIAQQFTEKQITGRVVDAQGAPIIGANIIETGTTNGTITDIDGNFSLNVDNNASLKISYIGYLEQNITTTGRTSFNIVLLEDNKALEEVVVVGYDIQKKSVVTGAISSVKAEDLQNQSISRAEQALQGRTSGVQVIQNSGAPGANMNIRIRGYGSNLSSEPIYIVNGTRVSNLSAIDPNDIANIEVLKDAASAAIYGAEGANGVVLVTTKNGTRYKGRINYEYQHSIQTLAHKVDVLDAHDYKIYMTEAGTLPQSALNLDYDTDWQDEIFKPSQIKKHYLSFTGGGEKGSFMLSSSYLDQNGIVVGDKDRYKRFSFMFNSDYQLNEWIKAGHNLTFSTTSLRTVAENDEYSSVITSALMLDPLTPVIYQNDDELPPLLQTNIANGYKYLKDKNDKYYGVSQFVSELVNPYVNRDRVHPLNENNNLFGNVFLEFKPLKGLNITSRFGGNILGIHTHNYQPVYYYDALSNNFQTLVNDATVMSTYWQWENFAIYNRSFGLNNTTFLLGMSSSENKVTNLSGDGGPLTLDSPLFDDLQFLAANPSDNVSSSRLITRKVSYFGRINYDYDNKYLFQASIRKDGAGSDILPKNTRWGIFPAISAGWVVSNEVFFPKNTPISFLKLRGSWGQNGSLSNLGNFQYLAPLKTSGSYPYLETNLGNVTEPTNLNNPNLKWETSEQTDLGLEIRAAKDRISFSMDYYIKKTKDLLTLGTPPVIAGNKPTTVNAGNVENRGFEFDLSYRNQIRDFNYKVSANLSTLHNEVTYIVYHL